MAFDWCFDSVAHRVVDASRPIVPGKPGHYEIDLEEIARVLRLSRRLNTASTFASYVAAISCFALLTRFFGPSVVDPETRCRKCGYILRGITEPRCSECGESI